MAENNKIKSKLDIFLIIILILLIIVWIIIYFEQIISFLNLNSGGIQAISTVVLVIVTLFYTIFTHQILIQNKMQIQELSKPDISVFLENDIKSYFWINLIVKNTGNSIAKNITFKISPEDYLYLRTDKLSELGFIKSGIPTLATNQEIKTFFENLYENWDIVKEKNVHITVTFEDIYNKKYMREYIISFKMYDKVTELGEHPLNQIAKELKGINSKIKIR